MGLTKEGKREYQREYMRRKSSNSGSNITDGSNGQGLTDYPDIIDKLTDPFWRDRLERICMAFGRSPNKQCTWLGNLDLEIVCDLLDCTA